MAAKFKYDAETRANALALIQRHNGKITPVSKLLNIPVQTLFEWSRQDATAILEEKFPGLGLSESQAMALRAKCWTAIQKAFVRLNKVLETTKSPRELATTISILVNKASDIKRMPAQAPKKEKIKHRSDETTDILRNRLKSIEGGRGEVAPPAPSERKPPDESEPVKEDSPTEKPKGHPEDFPGVEGAILDEKTPEARNPILADER